jgi:hypothetical protein
MSKEFDTHVFGQLVKLRFKLFADFDVPSQQSSMVLNTYGVKVISGEDFLLASELANPTEARAIHSLTYTHA